jgi:hypothetical protein
MVCEDFVWPDGFARGWTDALRLSYLTIRLTTCDCRAHGSASATRQSPRCAVVGSLSAGIGGFGTCVDGGSSIWTGNSEYHHARGPKVSHKDPPDIERSRGNCARQWCARRVGTRDSQVLEVLYAWPLCSGLPQGARCGRAAGCGSQRAWRAGGVSRAQRTDCCAPEQS